MGVAVGGYKAVAGEGGAVHEVPALLAGYPYLGYGYGLHYPYGVVATAGSGSPVAVGGYKAVAGEGGAVHEVPALFGAPAVLKQESEGGVSLSTGTGAYIIG